MVNMALFYPHEILEVLYDMEIVRGEATYFPNDGNCLGTSVVPELGNLKWNLKCNAADVHMFEMDCVLTSSKVETFLMRTRWGRSILEVDAKLRPVCVLYVLFCFFYCDILQLIHTVHIDLIDWCFCQGHLISRNVPLFAKQIAPVPLVWRMYPLITHWYQIWGEWTYVCYFD